MNSMEFHGFWTAPISMTRVVPWNSCLATLWGVSPGVYRGAVPAGSRSAVYEWFGTGKLTPLAVLVPISKPATHTRGESNQHPRCTVYILMCYVGSHWITVKIRTGQQVNSRTSLSYYFRHVTEVMHWNGVLVTCTCIYIYINTELYTYIFSWRKQPLASPHFCFNWWNKNQNITFILTHNLLWGLQMACN